MPQKIDDNCRQVLQRLNEDYSFEDDVQKVYDSDSCLVQSMLLVIMRNFSCALSKTSRDLRLHSCSRVTIIAQGGQGQGRCSAVCT